MRKAGFELVVEGKKEVEIAPNRAYPAIFGVWRKPD
jgi:hypothetical protein